MSNFVDECGINVCAGDGGAGVVSFRREAHVSRGVQMVETAATVGIYGLKLITILLRS